MPQINRTQLAAFAPNIPFAQLDTYVSAINATFAKYGIDQSLRRIRYFMAQVYHETQGLTKFKEDLTYKTPERLVAVWPTRFTMDKAKVGTHAVNPRTGKPYAQALAYAPDYVNNPVGLGELVYGGRADLGNTHPGDGGKYPGRGGFHLTGYANYAGYSQRVYGDARILNNPDLVAQPTDAFLSAGDYWANRKYVDTTGKVWNNFNELADADQFTFMSISIQGDASTVSPRLDALRLANKVFTG